jgi:uncharacterized protein (TIGR02145 family)
MKNILSILLLSTMLYSCENKHQSNNTNQSQNEQIKDCDGNIYKTLKIGNQTFMGENLNVSQFRNREPIPQAQSNEEWARMGKNGQPAWCYYNNNPAYSKYGKLYNWYAINDPRGIAPEGWHIPNNEEWTELTQYLGGIELVGKKIKSDSGWNDNGNGTNESGFAALGSGDRDDDNFYDLGSEEHWWSSTSDDGMLNGICCLNAYQLAIYSKGHPEWGYKEDASFGSSYKGFGFSVRCVKDKQVTKEEKMEIDKYVGTWHDETNGLGGIILDISSDNSASYGNGGGPYAVRFKCNLKGEKVDLIYVREDATFVVHDEGYKGKIVARCYLTGKNKLTFEVICDDCSELNKGVYFLHRAN